MVLISDDKEMKTVNALADTVITAIKKSSPKKKVPDDEDDDFDDNNETPPENTPKI